MQPGKSREFLAAAFVLLATSLVHAQPADWSWIGSLNYADEAARQDLKACLLANAARLAAIESATFQYEGVFEHFTPPIRNGKVDVAHRLCAGKGWYRRGHYHNEITFDGGTENELKISSLWTPALLASTEKHEIYGTFLIVDQPPATVADLDPKHFLAPALDPRWLICGFLGDGPAAFRKFSDRVEKIESARDGRLIDLTFLMKGGTFRAHSFFDSSHGFRLVRALAGRVQAGHEIVDLEETRVWNQEGPAALPSHFKKVRFIGPNHVGVIDYDVDIMNTKLDGASGVSRSDVTLNALEIPDGTHGVDRRSNPVKRLVRVQGRVRQPRPGEFAKLPPALMERLDQEQKIAMKRREEEARAILAARWWWSVSAVSSLAVAVLLGGAVGWRIFKRLRLS